MCKYFSKTIEFIAVIEFFTNPITSPPSTDINIQNSNLISIGYYMFKSDHDVARELPTPKVTLKLIWFILSSENHYASNFNITQIIIPNYKIISVGINL